MIYDSDYFVGSALNGDSLSHHGVPNQRWGVKNGPPYPVKRGHDVHYSVGKMTDKTKTGLQKAGKITASGAKAVGNAAKNIVKKTSSSFTRWKNEKKLDLATKPTDNALMKSWQKKQLRISDMTNQELQQRIERKKLEETYKHALRGDFRAPANWLDPVNGKGKGKGDGGNQKGKQAADGILKRVGEAMVEGVVNGVSKKIEYRITTQAKKKVDRREARRDAVNKVVAEAEARQAKYKKDQSYESWKANQDRKADAKKERKRRRYNDSMNRARQGQPFLGNGNTADYYWYAQPDEWTIS